MKFVILILSVISMFGLPFGARCLEPFGQYPKPQVVIPLKVWVVLHTGESIGDQSNFGCRTPLADMRARIKHLRQHADLYGANLVFDWPLTNTPTIIVDPAIDLSDRFRDATSFFLQQVTNNWEPDHLNIYFVGNIPTTRGVPNSRLAGTSDPQATCDLGGGPPCLYHQHMIFMNDTGFDTGFGVHFTPTQYTNLNILEHEVTHFFARWEGVGIYDASEHTTVPNNILRPGMSLTTPIKLPLHIPGSFYTVGSDSYQIWDRIRAHQWLNP